MCNGDVGEVDVAERCLGSAVELDNPSQLGGHQLERIELARTGDLGGQWGDEIEGILRLVEEPLTWRVGLLLIRNRHTVTSQEVDTGRRRRTLISP